MSLWPLFLSLLFVLMTKTTLAGSQKHQYTVSIDTTKIQNPQALLQRIVQILIKEKGGSAASFKGTPLKPALVGVLGIKGLAALTRAGIKWQAVLRKTKRTESESEVSPPPPPQDGGGVKIKNQPILDYPEALKKTASKTPVRQTKMKKSSSRRQRRVRFKRH